MNTKQQFNSLSSRTSDLEKQIKTIQGGNSADWSAITNKPTAFPPSAHSHLISEVSNLQTTLDGKSNTGHTHDYSTLTSIPSTFTPSAHTHAITDVTNLQTTLNGKSDTGHTHAYSSLTSIPTSFTPSAHSHAITDVTNLQTTLNGKSDTGHTHAYSSLTSIPSTFPPSAHTHAEIGTLGSLNTTTKTDLVSAINEVNTKASGGTPYSSFADLNNWIS
jgi:hypothetical protein